MNFRYVHRNQRFNSQQLLLNKLFKTYYSTRISLTIFRPPFQSLAEVSGGLLVQNFLRGKPIVHFRAKKRHFRKFWAILRKKCSKNAPNLNFGKNVGLKKFRVPLENRPENGALGVIIFDPLFFATFGRKSLDTSRFLASRGRGVACPKYPQGG